MPIFDDTADNLLAVSRIRLDRMGQDQRAGTSSPDAAAPWHPASFGTDSSPPSDTLLATPRTDSFKDSFKVPKQTS